MAIALSFVAVGISAWSAWVATRSSRDARHRDQKRVKVRCYRSVLPGQGDGPSVAAITIEAYNVGVRPIELRGAGFVNVTNGEHVERATYVQDPPLPAMIPDGGSARLHYRVTDRELSATQLVQADQVYVRTSPDDVWFGVPDDWLRPLKIERGWF